MSTKTVRFLLSEIELYYDGDTFVDQGKTGRAPYSAAHRKDKNKFDNIVEARIEYPRSGAASVTTTKMLDLPSRSRVFLNTTDFWESGLFKEDIDSETRLKLIVSDRDSVSGFARWFRRVTSAMFKLSIGNKVKAITNVFQGAVATDLQSRIETGLKGDQKDAGITVLCQSKDIFIELHPNGFDAYIMKGNSRVSIKNGNELTIDLLAASTIRRPVGKKTSAPGSKIKKQKHIVEFKKNQKVGEAKIALVGA